MIGSARSIFLGFHGGRGVATGVGTMLVIQPLAVILAAPVFVGVILITRYVSLGSLLGSAAMIPAVALVFLVINGTVPPAYLIYAVVGVGVVWIAHADNIDRLIHGARAQVRPRAAERPERRRRRLRPRSMPVGAAQIERRTARDPRRHDGGPGSCGS